jgi:hypothetical protein
MHLNLWLASVFALHTRYKTKGNSVLPEFIFLPERCLFMWNDILSGTVIIQPSHIIEKNFPHKVAFVASNFVSFFKPLSQWFPEI